MTDGRDPQPAPDPVLDDLLEEFSDRLQAGGPADPDAFIREHPERAEALRRLLPAVQVLAALDRPSAPAADGRSRAGRAPPRSAGWATSGSSGRSMSMRLSSLSSEAISGNPGPTNSTVTGLVLMLQASSRMLRTSCGSS